MELKKAQVGGIVTLAMILGGIITSYLPDSTFYCESRDLVMECIRLSSTGKTCYTNEGRKICSEGWKPISNFLEEPTPVDIVKVFANEKWWECEAIDGIVNSYSKCKFGIYEGYLGELV